VNMIRQAKSTKAGCGDFPYSSVPWKWAVRMPVSDTRPEITFDAGLVDFVRAMVTTTLASGAEGPFVEVLQDKLKVPVTGRYGLDTVTAVKAWQQFYNGLRDPALPSLTVDGVCGPATWKTLFPGVS
jgi:peptidoglycan hydrolase-like protein with peptidoglycan-binding domain